MHSLGFLEVAIPDDIFLIINYRHYINMFTLMVYIQVGRAENLLVSDRQSLALKTAAACRQTCRFIHRICTRRGRHARLPR